MQTKAQRVPSEMKKKKRIEGKMLGNGLWVRLNDFIIHFVWLIFCETLIEGEIDKWVNIHTNTHDQFKADLSYSKQFIVIHHIDCAGKSQTIDGNV